MKNFTVDDYRRLFTPGALEQLLHMADHERDDADVQREVPKIKEALKKAELKVGDRVFLTGDGWAAEYPGEEDYRGTMATITYVGEPATRYKPDNYLGEFHLVPGWEVEKV